MVNLRTVRRVLALDLGLDDRTISSCLSDAGSVSPQSPDNAEIPLAEALRIISRAEALVPAPV